MKKLLTLLLSAGLFLMGTASSYGTPFTTTVSFNEQNQGYTTLPGRPPGAGNANAVYSFPLNLNVLFAPPAVTIDNAFVDITHQKNSNQMNAEIWLAWGGNLFDLGHLQDSNTAWKTDSFAIPTDLYPALPADSWTLLITLQETTNGGDDLWLKSATLHGDYTPAVPEPGTFVLLGAGLFGLSIFGRRRMQR